MRRIISYIYHYKREGGDLHKSENAGFCRVLQNCEKDMVTICFKDGCGVEGNAHIYMLREMGEEKSGEIKYKKIKIDDNLSVCAGVLNTKICVENSDGICVECGGRIYVALWKSAYENISIEETKVLPKEMDTARTKENMQRHKDGEKKNENCRSDKVSCYDDYTRVYNRLCKIRIMLDGIEYPAVKLKPYEIMFLPRSCWRMANNVFLMEGYYRYGHILFMQYEGRYVLAVPWKMEKGMERYGEKFGFDKCLVGYGYGKERDKRFYFLKKL